MSVKTWKLTGVVDFVSINSIIDVFNNKTTLLSSDNNIMYSKNIGWNEPENFLKIHNKCLGLTELVLSNLQDEVEEISESEDVISWLNFFPKNEVKIQHKQEANTLFMDFIFHSIEDALKFKYNFYDYLVY